MPILTTFGAATVVGYRPPNNSPLLTFSAQTSSVGSASSWTSTSWPIYIYATFISGTVTAATVNGTSMTFDPPLNYFAGWCNGGTNGVQTVVLTLSGGGTVTQYFTNTYDVLAPTPNATSSLSGTYTVPSGVTQIYLEGSGSGGGGGSASGPGENYIQVGGGGGGGQSFRGTITVTPGETITYSIGYQGFAAGWYTYDFGTIYYAPISQYYNAGNRGKSGSAGVSTTVSTSSGSLTLSASGGGAGGWASGGAGGSSGTKSGSQSGNITFSSGASGSGSQTGGNAGGFGVSGYVASGRGGNGISGSATIYDPVLYSGTPQFSYSGNQAPGLRGGASTTLANAYSGFGGGGSGGYGNIEGGSGNGGGGPGAPGYLIIKPVG